MFSPTDNSKYYHSDAELLLQDQSILDRNLCVTFNPKEFNPNSRLDEELKIPVFASEQMYQEYLTTNQDGNISIPRELGISIFYNGNADLLARGIIGSKEYPYCIAYVSTVDEYNSTRTRKRHNVGFSLEQKQPNYTGKYVTTTASDNKTDILCIAYSIGGATTFDDPNTAAEVIYSYQEKDQIYQNYINKSNMSPHDTCCNGNSVGFEVPDTMLANDGSYRTCYPALCNISCTTAWYNVGSYNGTKGFLKGNYIHTYKKKTISVSPSISLSGIDISVSGGTVDDIDNGWADATLSPF